MIRIFGRIHTSLKKTKEAMGKRISELFKRSELDDDFYDELEELLIKADVNIETVIEIIDKLKIQVRKKSIKDMEKAKTALIYIIRDMLDPMEPDFHLPAVMTLVGVNGAGKTTTVAKLAKYYSSSEAQVLIAAADTFRAAAIRQLMMWGDRCGTRVICQSEGADPSAIVYDAVCCAKAKGMDLLIIDTAGRLHNKVNLMEELKKMNRIKEKEWPEAKQLNVLVLDATIGQNAIPQILGFDESIGIDGIILTKLDGTAKGGIVLTIANQLKIPIFFLGFGEQLHDLQPFNAWTFAEALVDDPKEEVGPLLPRKKSARY